MSGDKELELINNVKERADEESLKILIEQNEKLVYKVYHKFAGSLAKKDINLRDLLDDKDYQIYDAIMTFKPEKGARFSTWLVNKLKYQCLNILNKEADRLCLDKDESITDIIDKEGSCQPIFENYDLQYVDNILAQINDKRIKDIFHTRFIKYKTKRPWKMVGQELGISTQTAINLFDKGKKLIQKKALSEKCFDKV